MNNKNKSKRGVFEVISKLLNLVEKKKIYIYISAVLLSISVIISLQGPKLAGKLTDIIIAGIKVSKAGINYNIDYHSLTKTALFATILYIIVFAITTFVGISITYVITKLIENLREKINEKINKLSIKQLDNMLAGEIISLVSSDMQNLTDSLRNIVKLTLTSIIMIVGSIGLMLFISVKLTLTVIVFLPIMIVIIAIITKYSQKYFVILQNKRSNLNSHIEEMYSNHEIIQAYNGQEKSIEIFDKINDDIFKTAISTAFFSGIMLPIVTTINNATYIAISFIGSILLSAQTLTIGIFQTFIQYLNGFHRPFSNLSNISYFMQKIKASGDRIFDFLELEEMPEEYMKRINIKKIEGKIIFDNVNFSYKEGTPILKNISFTVNKGEKVAIIGHTGSGKTTIINLLMKFYDIDSGNIFIDDININDIRREDIADIFTMVLQDTWLFNDTIKENVGFALNNNPDFNMIKEACIKADINHYIKTLPQGYDTLLNEQTTNISVGQKQLLTIARAFLKNSKILILDEATSSIDSRTELKVQKTMKNLMSDKTTFIIAHRLSTIKDCDKIILLDKGEIVEIGSHKELYIEGTQYKKLFDSQF